MLKKILFAATFAFAAAGAVASPAAPKEGADYQVLPNPQPTDSGKKVEVIEFFAYWCPHCYTFDPILTAWVKKQGDNIVFKRVHVAAGAPVVPQQKLFFTLESMGLVDQYQQKVFDAIHVKHNPLRSDAAVMEWLASSGIDKAKFTDIYNSFGTAAKVRRAERMMGDYRVDYWPMLFVDGKYMTSPAEANKSVSPVPNEAQQHANALMVLDFLVAKAKAEKK